MALEFTKAANDNVNTDPAAQERQKAQDRKKYIAQVSSLLNSVLQLIQLGRENAGKWEDSQIAAVFSLRKSYTEANTAVIKLEADPLNDELFQKTQATMEGFAIRLKELEMYLPSVSDAFDS